MSLDPCSVLWVCDLTEQFGVFDESLGRIFADTLTCRRDGEKCSLRAQPGLPAVGEIRDCAQVSLAFAYGFFGLLALLRFYSNSNKVHDRTGKILFLHRPLTDGPDVLVTDHTDDTAFQADRGIQHGADAQGSEIGAG